MIVVAGGFSEEDNAVCSKEEQNIADLKATHEEADTRRALHAIHCKKHSHCDNIMVSARDTYILLLLLSHPQTSAVMFG